VILGSGLGGFTQQVQLLASISTKDIPGFPVSTVPGHGGAIHSATYQGKSLLIFEGRIHGYEGYSTQQVVLPAIIAIQLGVKNLILSNAAGGLNPLFNTGEFMLIEDFLVLPHARKMGLELQQLRQFEHRPRHAALLSEIKTNLVVQSALEEGIHLHRGVYGYCSGPTYETRAEIHFFRKAGADVIGMSTVPEILVAMDHDIEVIAISCITNKTTATKTSVSHKEVTAVAANAGLSFSRLVLSVMRKL